MRNEKLKYGGLVTAIIGMIILAGSGYAYYHAGEPVLYVDPSQFHLPVAIGFFLLTVGLALFIIIEE